MELNSRLPGIQAGRAIAAASVFYFHSYIALTNFDPRHIFTFDWLAKHGASGVDLFFAISGFIVCHVAAAPDFGSGEFLWKRLFRIYPLNALVTVVILAILLSGIGIADYPDAVGVLKSFLIFPQTKPVNSVGWTLEYEVVFYLISALILPRGGPVALLLYCAASFALWTVFDPHSALLSRFITEKHAAFGAGVAAYIVASRLPKCPSNFDAVLSLLLLVVGLWMFISGPNWLPPGLRTPVACGFAVIGLAVMPGAPRFLVRFGDISYGFYLIHWPVVCLSPWLTGNDHLNLNRSLGELWRWVAFAIIYALAFLSWRYLEQPINGWARKFLHRSPRNNVACSQDSCLVQGVSAAVRLNRAHEDVPDLRAGLTHDN
ncbi:acyltransferase [Bradyrhizobium barranii]|uniref:Acyltransferase n=1 Tax=Bradyrhizobium barranii TaxID=2992140 RepID=A0ABY3QFP9_9BRAD|nr:acyltransferase [Bradyrhizobium japonicum]UFW84448.1 acyltransferase [Bradyrhizobium japonicum]